MLKNLIFQEKATTKLQIGTILERGPQVVAIFVMCGFSNILAKLLTALQGCFVQASYNLSTSFFIVEYQVTSL